MTSLYPYKIQAFWQEGKIILKRMFSLVLLFIHESTDFIARQIIQADADPDNGRQGINQADCSTGRIGKQMGGEIRATTGKLNYRHLQYNNYV